MPDTELTIPETMTIEAVTPTVTDAPETPAEQPKSASELAREAIYAKREAAIARELAYGEEMADAAREDAGAPSLADPEPEPVAAAATEPEPAAEPAAEPVVTQAAPQPEITAQVQRFPFDLGNGQVAWLTGPEVAQFARLGMVANQAMATQQPVQQPAPEPPRPAIDAERARALVKAIAYGSEDDGVAALTEFVGGIAPRQPQIDPVAIADVATRAAYSRMRRDQDLAATAMEYPEIFGEPGKPMTMLQQRASQLATLELATLHQRYSQMGVQKPDLDLYREAASNVVRDLSLRQPSQPKEETHSPAIQAAPSKLESKRAAPRLPNAAGRTASLGSDEARPPTGSEIVARIRAARHQSPMN